MIVAGVGSSGIRRRESFAGPLLVLLAPALTDVSFPIGYTASHDGDHE